MKRLTEDRHTALYELSCGFSGLRLVVDKDRHILSVLVPYEGNNIEIDKIGLSVNDWMVCVPFGHITFSSVGLSVPYESRGNPFFDNVVGDACNRLANVYHIDVA